MYRGGRLGGYWGKEVVEKEEKEKEEKEEEEDQEEERGGGCHLNSNSPTLKGGEKLPMCKFDKNVNGNRYVFQHCLEICPKYPPNDPYGAGAVGSRGGYLGYLSKRF